METKTNWGRQILQGLCSTEEPIPNFQSKDCLWIGVFLVPIIMTIIDITFYSNMCQQTLRNQLPPVSTSQANYGAAWLRLLSFQVSTGREWYIHTIYTVRSHSSANRGIGKRSLEYHAVSRQMDLLPGGGRRSRRSATDGPDVINEIGMSNNRGTNILHITLDRSSIQQKTSLEREIVTKGVLPREVNQKEDGDDGLVLIIGVVVGLLLTVLVAIVVALLVRSRREKKKDVPSSSSSTEPMMTRVHSSSGSSNRSNDSSEV